MKNCKKDFVKKTKEEDFEPEIEEIFFSDEALLLKAKKISVLLKN